MFRRRQCRDFAAFVPALDGHAVRATLLHGRRPVALASGALVVDTSDRDVVVRLTVGTTTFLIETSCFRMAVYSPPPAARLVVTSFEAVPLTLVAVLVGDEDELDVESR